MKFGVCVGATERENIEAVAKAGADYLEFGLFSVEPLKAEGVKELNEYLKGLNIPVYAFCSIVPGRYHVTGENTNAPDLVTYLDYMMNMTECLSPKCWVFGSAGARKLQEGQKKGKNQAQILDFLRQAAPVFEKHGQTLVIEPLNSAEDNTINTVADAMMYVRTVNSPGVAGLADFYHTQLEEEDLSTYSCYKDDLKHCHIAAPGRALPLPGDGNEDYYRECLSTLKKIGYDGGLTIEVRRGDTFRDQIAESLSYLRSLWAEV